jgi:hypothetical protein
MEHTHNGFYEELDELQKDGADDFGFLENICAWSFFCIGFKNSDIFTEHLLFLVYI